MPETAAFARPFADLRIEDIPLVGGKNASLGEMRRELAAKGVAVPDGFALTVAAFDRHLDAGGLRERIFSELDALDVEDVTRLAEVGARLRAMVHDAPLPPEVAAAARAAYAELSAQYGVEACDVAVRSSATAEDLPTASFAGQQETYLNIHGWAALEEAIRACMASLYTDRAIVYRVHNRIPHREVALSVGVQKMVRADRACSGVLFTLDTESGFRDVVLITGAWGLGELVVQGRVSPDEFWVHKPSLRSGFRPVLRRERGAKAVKMIYTDSRRHPVREVRVPRSERERLVLDDEEVLQLARWAMIIEEHYSAKAGTERPMDIEWAKDGESGELFIVQARPETVHAQQRAPVFETHRLLQRGELLTRGKSVGSRIASGRARIIHHSGELHRFQDGEILVAEMTDPDWEPVLKRARAVVTDHGGRTCHAAIVSRELGLPCVVGTGDATGAIADGAPITVSCAEGDEGRVYAGELEFHSERIAFDQLPPSPVPLMLNLADPDRAFHLAALPCAGVGLLRMEFLIANWIGVHPMALLHPELVSDARERAEIARRCRGYPQPAEFFVERLASGIGLIAAAFHPRPVILRMSDFKTNEYASLLGGQAFEPHEHNPMIGFRGACRYYDERYREGFGLECQAVQRVREEMGLHNLKVMIPFCRTPEEGRKVLAVMAEHGLRRGEDGLEVYVMCEIPSNVVLAERFAEHFDGFSIGSNDLTQLTLGLDRDSDLVAHLFDERDEAVRRLIAQVVHSARQHGRKVGICGQAPSDHPDFAKFLAELQIDSISLTPDALPKVLRALGE